MILKSGEVYLLADAGDAEDPQRQGQLFEADGTEATPRLKLHQILRFSTGNDPWEPVDLSSLPEPLRKLV